ncbi:MAG: sigma-54-dependent transcriptional regulator [Rhodocyclaceae bacterium]
MKSPLLIVEDDLIMGESLVERFTLEGYEVQWCNCAEAALDELRVRRVGLIISDLRMPGMGGRELLRRLHADMPVPPPVILITGYGSVGEAVEALKEGAADYITKPFDLNALVAKAAALCMPAHQSNAPPLGISAAMRQLEAILPRIAGQARTVLLSGESGVGKECVARRLHLLACTKAQLPFVAVNCAALPDNLLEAELFGYEKGAFTGAVQARAGLFEAAGNGTLFLDEIGEISPVVQTKLLRAVQEREIRRLGGQKTQQVAARLIFATNRDLRAEVEAGRFREDLYYRINVVNLRIPPLRERREDIPWLARNFVAEQSRTLGGPRRSIDPATLEALTTLEWPGNVRELKHAIERACILAATPLLHLEDLLTDTAPDTSSEPSASSPLNAPRPPADYHLNDYLQRCERNFIDEALRAHDGRMTETARALGVSRKGLWEKLRRLGLRQG